ncbi:hypothetical protein DFP72DRAFT_893960 [Ephemerocybe angulata]|uniref:Uncharacterized protein n=1 Tax=Ephemerocybe angulata TaxID=980116 RepID=A0A8H6I1T4_9AGAR|nr:hypothetical protein DFP72DRAFT_893960 [Tulosesus angulatus]
MAYSRWDPVPRKLTGEPSELDGEANGTPQMTALILYTHRLHSTRPAPKRLASMLAPDRHTYPFGHRQRKQVPCGCPAGAVCPKRTKRIEVVMDAQNPGGPQLRVVSRKATGTYLHFSRCGNLWIHCEPTNAHDETRYRARRRALMTMTVSQPPPPPRTDDPTHRVMPNPDLNLFRTAAVSFTSHAELGPAESAALVSAGAPASPVICWWHCGSNAPGVFSRKERRGVASKSLRSSTFAMPNVAQVGWLRHLNLPHDHSNARTATGGLGRGGGGVFGDGVAYLPLQGCWEGGG